MYDIIKVNVGGDAGDMCRQHLLPLLSRSVVMLGQSPTAIAINSNLLSGLSLVESIKSNYALAYRIMQHVRQY